MRKKAVFLVCVCTILGLQSLLFAGRPPQNANASTVRVRKFLVPGYPPLARQACIQDDIKATVHIRADGTVQSVSGGGHPREPDDVLYEPVLQALKTWEFEPTGSPEELQITFRFVLEGARVTGYSATRVSGELPDLIQISTNPMEFGPGGDVLSPC